MMVSRTGKRRKICPSNEGDSSPKGNVGLKPSNDAEDTDIETATATANNDSKANLDSLDVNDVNGQQSCKRNSRTHSRRICSILIYILNCLVVVTYIYQHIAAADLDEEYDWVTRAGIFDHKVNIFWVGMVCIILRDLSGFFMMWSSTKVQEKILEEADNSKKARREDREFAAKESLKRDEDSTRIKLLEDTIKVLSKQIAVHMDDAAKKDEANKRISKQVADLSKLLEQNIGSNQQPADIVETNRVQETGSAGTGRLTLRGRNVHYAAATVPPEGAAHDNDASSSLPPFSEYSSKSVRGELLSSHSEAAAVKDGDGELPLCPPIEFGST
eukprot:CAMPEP_0178661748 /NCGR_PEP_ID=MMETSP0698-20121128/27871_1 /TAXON_ID=265572 /ORGANISM="Extubocellulus spinifer, Strain CCMP396" /LENGTH=329 /DNA_ID=CAMNT_0020304587 /DNA_START=292 /DNA_END=1278 /DNA_ORIENTATION=+